jgi:anti-anti-sigma factor
MILEVQKKSPEAALGILRLRGKLLLGNDSRQVEWAVVEWIQGEVKSVILDLGGLQMIASTTGVGIIGMCHARLEKVGGSLRIAGAKGIIREILHMMHGDRIVRFFPAAEEASKNFGPAGEADRRSQGRGAQLWGGRKTCLRGRADSIPEACCRS